MDCAELTQRSLDAVFIDKTLKISPKTNQDDDDQKYDNEQIDNEEIFCDIITSAAFIICSIPV